VITKNIFISKHTQVRHNFNLNKLHKLINENIVLTEKQKINSKIKYKQQVN
jgi:hypothetical protein